MLFTTTALAQSPTAPSDPQPAAPTLPAPAQAAPLAAQPAPAGAIAVTLGSYTCTVGAHDGFDDADVRTTALLVCREVERKKAPANPYEIRFDKLGGRILFSVTDKQSGANRELLIQSIEEVPVVAPRLVDALVDNTTLQKTETVENVAGLDTRAPRLKPGQTSFDMGLVGLTSVGVDFGASAGIGMGLNFRLDRFAVTSHGRLGGIGSSDNKTSFASLDVGGRYYLGDEDVAPFAGGGFQLAYFNAIRDGSGIDGSGLGAFAEVGVEALRTGRIGIIGSIRADVPFFDLKNSSHYGRYDDTTGAYLKPTDERRYVVPLSLNLGIVFR